MDLAAYERWSDGVDVWVNQQTDALAAAGIQVIECADLVQDHASSIILPTKSFQPFLQATGQSVVFLYRGTCDVSARIQATIEEVCETGEDPSLLVRAFEKQQAPLVSRALTTCPHHFYAELTVLHQGGFVTTGVVSQAYENLLAELSDFCEGAEDQRAQAKAAELAHNEATIDALTEELVKDSAFAAIRGKRKRCLYVADKLGVRVPRHPRGEIRRVDQTCDPMDANLVVLVERVSDRLELLR